MRSVGSNWRRKCPKLFYAKPLRLGGQPLCPSLSCVTWPQACLENRPIFSLMLQGGFLGLFVWTQKELMTLLHKMSFTNIVLLMFLWFSYWQTIIAEDGGSFIYSANMYGQQIVAFRRMDSGASLSSNPDSALCWLWDGSTSQFSELHIEANHSTYLMGCYVDEMPGMGMLHKHYYITEHQTLLQGLEIKS